MTNSNQKFKTVHKDRLFYDKFVYCMSFDMDEASCLRELNHQYIDVMVERRRQWREISMQRWATVRWNNKTILSRKTKEISDVAVQNLHLLADVLLNSEIEFKLVVSLNTAWIYTNSVKLVDQLDILDFLTLKKYTQAQVTRPKDTVRLKKPKHQYRSYFTGIKLTQAEKNNLCNFFKNQKDHVRISSSLENFLSGGFYRLQDYFFFDYTGESWLLMLSLIKPGLIRKTLTIIPG